MFTVGPDENIHPKVHVYAYIVLTLPNSDLRTLFKSSVKTCGQSIKALKQQIKKKTRIMYVSHLVSDHHYNLT